MRDLMAIIRDNKLVKCKPAVAAWTQTYERSNLSATSPYLNKPLRTIAQIERERELAAVSRERTAANRPWHPGVKLQVSDNKKG